MADTSKHSRFFKKCLEKNIIKEIAYKGNIRKVTGLTMSSGPDQRLKDPKFKAAVRTVLNWFGLESKMSNFKMVEGKANINWIKFADNIKLNHPEPDYLDVDKWKLSCIEIERGKHESKNTTLQSKA